jgi:serine/threonine protein kinase
MIGRTIAHYQVVEQIGAGGMGIVYKARDTHLDRFVAMKVLPPESVSDPERKWRFVQEAKAASALNHPNIVTVHDIDHQDDIDFIVMEFVVGKTLDELIPHKGMRLNDLLKCAVQVADALATAHSGGIIHRDVKPGNIIMGADGRARVLDFGLAKLVEQALPGDEDLTLSVKPKTERGTLIGTVNYMSPEQAEGHRLDARTDIFSFGAVLYEMATGRRAFQGNSKTSILAAILHNEPEPMGAKVPYELQRIITRCLHKDRERRLQSMKDLRVELEELKEESTSGKLPLIQARKQQRRDLRWITALLGLASLGVAAWWRWPDAPTRLASEASLTPVPLTSYEGNERHPSFSPDGTQVAFAMKGDIYIKQINIEPPSPLINTPEWEISPAWSPDGQFVAFWRDGPEPDTSQVVRVPQRGGREKVLATIKRFGGMVIEPPYLAWTPNSKWLVCPARQSGQEPWGLFLLPTEGGQMTRLTEPPAGALGDSTPAVSLDGHTLLFSRQNRISPELYKLNLAKDLTPQGQAEPLQLAALFGLSPAWMPDGKEIVFIARRRDSLASLWRTPIAKPHAARQLALPGEIFSHPAISMQAHRLAYGVARRGNPDIWRIDLTGPARKPSPALKLISSTALETRPAFSRDGSKIAFVSTRSGHREAWLCDRDGSNQVQVTSLQGPAVLRPRCSPDGAHVAFESAPENGSPDVYVMAVNGEPPTRLTTHPAADRWPAWSRDGKQIYFSSDRSGMDQIWKLPASGGEAIQVTRNGGDIPRESADGKSLFYRKGSPAQLSIWHVPVEGGPEVKVFDGVQPNVGWDVAANGIYFFKRGAQDLWQLSLFEFASSAVRDITVIERRVAPHLAVTLDGRTILYTQLDEEGFRDLMMVEGFR